MSVDLLEVNGLLADRARSTPDALALEAPGRRPLSYADLARNVRSVAAGLRASGVRSGERVAVLLPEGPEQAVALLAVMASATCAPLNPAHGLHDGERHLAALRATWLLVQAGSGTPLVRAAAGLGLRVLEVAFDAQSDDGGYQLLPGCADGAAPTAPVAPDDVVVALPTSGTTGTPKIVPLTRRNLGLAIDSVCRALALGPDDACLGLMPKFHVGGLVSLLLAPLAGGGRIVCVPGFDAAQFESWLERHRPTWFQAVPATMSALLAHARRAGLRELRTSLRFIRSGAAALSPRLQGELEALFQVPVVQTYGMTEAAPLITTTPLPPGRSKPGSVGKPAGPEVTIRDAAGDLLPCRAVGEVVIRGGNVTRGYENAPEANEQAFRGGWFHTGDLGWLDEDGDLFLTGRASDVVNRGGEKFSPAEVDQVLMEHPSVAEAVAYPVPHAELGQDLAAAVVPREGAAPTPEALREFVATRLAPFKVPRTVTVLDALPKGPTGKVARSTLHDELGARPTAPPPSPYEGPRTEEEAWVAEAWKKLFARERVGIHDDFFACGGDSYGVVDLTSQIEQRFGLTLPLHAVALYPTVAGLARLIAERVTDPSGRLSSELRGAGQRPLFWFVEFPQATGLPVVPLETYWEASPERDVFGVSIEELAAGYLERIKSSQAGAPYRVGGFSVGALLALEAAQRLRDDGDQASLLFLLDPADPAAGSAAARPAALFSWRRAFWRLLDGLGELALWPACRRLLRWRGRLRGPLLKYYASRVYRHAVARYRPRPYEGPTTVYLRRRGYERRRALWLELCPRARVCRLDADDHFAVMEPPHREVWLHELEQDLAKDLRPGAPTGA